MSVFRFNLVRKSPLWEHHSVVVETEDGNEEINIFDAENPTSKKLNYAILFDQKLEVRNVSELLTEVNKTLFELNPQSYFASALGEKLNLTRPES